MMDSWNRELLLKKQRLPVTMGASQFFFHSPLFVSAQKNSSFCFSLVRGEEVIGQICFSKNKTMAESLARSPFGNFDLVPGIIKDELIFFTERVLDELQTAGFRKVCITSFPECYNKEHAHLIHEVLTTFDVTPVRNDVHQYLAIDEQPFKNIVKADERRYLNKAKKEGFTFKTLGLSYLPKAYELIHSCRIAKGYSISMTYNQVEKAILQFPDHYLIFGIFLNEQLIAASICVKINGNILYDFYHGDDLSFRSYSPVVPLIEGLYTYASVNGFKLVDLGTSIEEGVYLFKKNLGARDSNKLIFEKQLEAL